MLPGPAAELHTCAPCSHKSHICSRIHTVLRGLRYSVCMRAVQDDSILLSAGLHYKTDQPNADLTSPIETLIYSAHRHTLAGKVQLNQSTEWQPILQNTVVVFFTEHLKTGSSPNRSKRCGFLSHKPEKHLENIMSMCKWINEFRINIWINTVPYQLYGNV